MSPQARPRRLHGGVLLAAALVLSGATVPLGAGRIEGTIRDSAGAPVADAQIGILNRPWSTLSDSVGRYRLADLPTGRHTIRVAAPGYRDRVVRDVRVEEGQATISDVTLAPSAPSEGEREERRGDLRTRLQSGVAPPGWSAQVTLRRR